MAMIYAQMSGISDIRPLIASFNAHPSQFYHLNTRPIRRTTLSDALSLRPVEIFSDILSGLIKQARGKSAREADEMLQLLDSSPIALRESAFDWAEADGRTRGLKLHILYDPVLDIPLDVAITSAKVPDIAQGRKIALEAGMTYVFDKGYCDYGWWYQINEANACFVTRLKNNAYRSEQNQREVNAAAKKAGIISDREINVGHPSPRGGKINPLAKSLLREVTVAREDGKAPLVLVTNDLDRSAQAIASLYKDRWQIELFFKHLKQNLKIKSFFSTSENGVKIQIICALIAHLLIKIMRQTMRHIAHSTKAIHKLVARNLQQRCPISQLLRPPDTPITALKTHINQAQMSLEI